MSKCCDPRAPRPQTLIVGGSAIGVLGLDEVVARVSAMEGIDEEQAAIELLAGVRRLNYVPDAAAGQYAEALLLEYRKYFSGAKKWKGKGSVMEIKVLGPGCKNCKTLESIVLKVVAEMGIEARVEKVENPRQIVELGVMMTPGLIVNGKIKSTGRIPKSEEIARWIKEEQK